MSGGAIKAHRKGGQAVGKQKETPQAARTASGAKGQNHRDRNRHSGRYLLRRGYGSCSETAEPVTTGGRA